MPSRGKSGWHTFEHKYHNPGSHKTTIGSKLKKEPEDNAGHVQFCQKCGAWFGALGLEPTPELFVDHIVEIFREVRRVLRDDGTCWINLGDSYAASRSYQVADNKHPKVGAQRNLANSKPPPGLKQKDLVGIPWMVAFALRSDGWWLRQDIIWHKPNPMPESVTDRCTKAHEYIFLLSKSQRYYFDHEAIKEPSQDNHPHYKNTTIEYKSINSKRGNEDGKPTSCFKEYRRPANNKRNKRSVWTVSTKPYKGAHFATFPPDLIEPCILAGCPEGGTVLDPFGGSGTTGEAALKHFRKVILIELKPEYGNELIAPRLEAEAQRYKQQELFK